MGNSLCFDRDPEPALRDQETLSMQRTELKKLGVRKNFTKVVDGLWRQQGLMPSQNMDNRSLCDATNEFLIRQHLTKFTSLERFYNEFAMQNSRVTKPDFDRYMDQIIRLCLQHIDFQLQGFGGSGRLDPVVAGNGFHRPPQQPKPRYDEGYAPPPYARRDDAYNRPPQTFPSQQESWQNQRSQPPTQDLTPRLIAPEIDGQTPPDSYRSVPTQQPRMPVPVPQPRSTSSALLMQNIQPPVGFQDSASVTDNQSDTAVSFANEGAIRPAPDSKRAYSCESVDDMIDVLRSEGVPVELYSSASKRMERKRLRLNNMQILILDDPTTENSKTVSLKLNHLRWINAGEREAEPGASQSVITTAFVFKSGSLCVRFMDPDVGRICTLTEELCHQAFQQLRGVEIYETKDSPQQ